MTKKDILHWIELQNMIQEKIIEELKKKENWKNFCDCEEFDNVYEYIDFESSPSKRITIKQCTDCGGFVNL